MSTATIKFGQGYEAPWLVADHDDVETIRNFLIVASGLDPEHYTGASLIRIQIEVSRLARGLYKQISDSDEAPRMLADRVQPESVPAERDQKPKRNTKGGLAAQAKVAAEATKRSGLNAEAVAKSNEPEESTTDIPALIANAITDDALHDIFNKYEKQWQSEYNELAAARVAEIRGEAA